MRAAIVPELGNVGMTVEEGLNHSALHAPATTVDDAYFSQSGGRRRANVFVNNRWHVGRVKRVKVDLSVDRNADRLDHVRNRCQGFLYSAVTVVLIPPRTEKSPTTRIWRGCRSATRSSRIWLVTDS